MIASKVFGTVGVLASLASACNSTTCNFVLDYASQKQAADNYIAAWNGDFSVENVTFMPNVNFYQDRVPRANGTAIVPIGSSAELINWMKMAHTGWNQYQFIVDNVAFDKYNIVIRWTLNGTVGPPDKMIIPVKKPEGTHIAYSGTDWLQLDNCTGKIKQVDESQDFFTALHAQGFTEIKI